jgi:hypothetical protein
MEDVLAVLGVGGASGDARGVVVQALAAASWELPPALEAAGLEWLAPDLAAALGAIAQGGGDEEVRRAAARVLAPLQRALP